MGVCACKKQKSYITPNNPPNQESSQIYDLEGSQFIIQDFSPLTKTPSTKIKSTLKAPILSQLTYSKSVEVFQSTRQNEKFERTKIVLPKISLKNPENARKGFSHHPKSTIEFSYPQYQLTAEVTEPLKPFTSLLFINEKFLKNLIVYHSGLVILPKALTKTNPGTYVCEYYGELYTLQLYMVLNSICVFKLPCCKIQGYPLTFFTVPRNQMTIKILGETYTLTKVLFSKNSFSSSKPMQKSLVGEVINLEDKPCFIIQSISDDINIKILKFSKLGKAIQHPFPAPTLPIPNLSTAIYNSAHVKLFEGFQYEKLIFWFCSPENLPEDLLISLNGHYSKLHLIQKNFFALFETQGLSATGLEKYENTLQKLAYLFTKNETISFYQSTKNSEVYKTNSKFAFTSKFIGFPLFGSNYQPIGIIIRIKTSNALTIAPLSKLKHFLFSLCPNFYYHPKQKTHFSSLSSSSVSSSSSSEYIPILSSVHKPEADLSPKAKNFTDFTSCSTISQPEETSYMLTGGTLLKYSKNHFTPEVVPLPLSYSESSTYTSTIAGLVMVQGTFSKLFQGPKIVSLRPLQEPHFFHTAVVHKTQLFVISGKGTSSVECLDLINIFENWKQIHNLPEIREQPAACSSGPAIYVLGGVCESIVKGTVFKFCSRWETLNWTVPAYFGMGAFFVSNSIVLFGGKGLKSFNDLYFRFSTAGQELFLGEFPVSGVFANKSVGRSGDVFSIVLSERKSLEFSDCRFKMVLMSSVD